MNTPDAIRCTSCDREYRPEVVQRLHERGTPCRCGAWSSWEGLWWVRCFYCGANLHLKDVADSHGCCQPACPQAREMLGGELCDRLDAQ